MQKTCNLKSTQHKQRAHVQEKAHPQDRRQGKRHFMLDNQETAEERRVERVHKHTVDVKLEHDIYSNAFRSEHLEHAAKKV